MIKTKEILSKMWRPEPDDSSRSDFFRFERNERTTLFKEKEFNEIISTITPYDLVAYGELEPFYNKIKNWLEVDRKNILLTSGSDAGIKTVYETYISPSDEVLITLPNYAMFSVYADMYGAKSKTHIYGDDFRLNTKNLIEKINRNTKLIVISNPGHTGTIVPEKEILEIINVALVNNTIVLIDEAYHHFYSDTMVRYINDFDNLIITRTFSKAFGLASIRIGILIANEKVINELYKVKLVHEITGLAAKIGCYFLDHLDIVDRYVKDVNLGKEVLYTRLKKIGFELLKSEANFVFFKVPSSTEPSHLKEYLETKKIFIRGPFAKHPFDQHLRITAGDKNQMNVFCDAIEDYINNFQINN